jgi:hypothetical protein
MPGAHPKVALFATLTVEFPPFTKRRMGHLLFGKRKKASLMWAARRPLLPAGLCADL